VAAWRASQNEAETLFIRAVKKYFPTMDFPISGDIFIVGQT